MRDGFGRPRRTIMKDLSLHLMDIIQNSIRAQAANIRITIEAAVVEDFLAIKVEDDGCGMDDKMLSNVMDPFVTTRTTRKVGLGISLFKDSAERAGGKLILQSEPGVGTALEAWFRIGSIDRQPLGDISSTMTSLILSHGELDFVLTLRNSREEFLFDTKDIRKMMGEIPITHLDVIAWMEGHLHEGVMEIFSGILGEIG